jgi:hypothetical protein
VSWNHFRHRRGYSGRRQHILDEVALLLGRGVDGGTSGGLGLGATTHGEVGAGEHCAEDGHGELVGKKRLACASTFPAVAADGGKKG